MKRFLPLLILSNILLGQGITNSLISYLPELTEYPKSKYVLVERYNYIDSFGEFLEKRDSSHSVYQFDDKGRKIKEWDYYLYSEAKSKTGKLLLSTAFDDIANNHTSKIKEFSAGLMYERQAYLYEDDNTMVYSIIDSGSTIIYEDGTKKRYRYEGNDWRSAYDPPPQNFIYKIKYDDKGYRIQIKKFKDTGEMSSRTKSDWIDKNTLIETSYWGEDGQNVDSWKRIFLDGKLIYYYNYPQSTENYPLGLDTVRVSYSYSWENDTLLSTTIKSTHSLIILKDQNKIYIVEDVFDNNGFLRSHKVSNIKEKFGERTAMPQYRKQYSYFNSLNELYDYHHFSE